MLPRKGNERVRDFCLSRKLIMGNKYWFQKKEKEHGHVDIMTWSESEVFSHTDGVSVQKETHWL